MRTKEEIMKSIEILEMSPMMSDFDKAQELKRFLLCYDNKVKEYNDFAKYMNLPE